MYGPFWTLTVRTGLQGRGPFITHILPADSNILPLRHNVISVLDWVLPIRQTLQLRLYAALGRRWTNICIWDGPSSSALGDPTVSRRIRMGHRRMAGRLGLRDGSLVSVDCKRHYPGANVANLGSP